MMRPGPKWIPGVIIERKGPLSYVVETEKKQVWHKHAEQVKVLGGEDAKRYSDEPDNSELDYPTETSSPTNVDAGQTDSLPVEDIANAEGESCYPIDS